MKYFFSILFFFINSISIYSQTKSCEYINEGFNFLKMDSLKIYECKFKLILPNYTKSVVLTKSVSFIYEFNFRKFGKIILINNPLGQVYDIESLNLSLNEFKKTIGTDYADIIKKTKLRNNKRFGVKKIKNQKFILIYLNILNSDVEKFNYSIKNIVFL